MTGAVGRGAGGGAGGVVGRVVGRVLSQPLWLAAIVASAGAGVIHLAHGPAHLDELGALGAGFYLAAALQLGWAAMAFAVLTGFRTPSSPRRTAALSASGIAINGAILAAWVTSRVVGLPAGAAPWTPAPIGLADGISAILQGLLAIGLLATLRGWTLPRLPRVQRLATAAAATGMLLIATGTAVAISPSAVGHGHSPGYLHTESGKPAGGGEQTAPGQHADTDEHAATDRPAATDEHAESSKHAEDGGHGVDDGHGGTDEHTESDEHAEDGGH